MKNRRILSSIILLQLCVASTLYPALTHLSDGGNREMPIEQTQRKYHKDDKKSLTTLFKADLKAARDYNKEGVAKGGWANFFRAFFRAEF